MIPKRYWKSILLSLTVLYCAGVAAYASYDAWLTRPQMVSTQTGSPSAPPPLLPLLPVGSKAPGFTLHTLDGKAISLNQYQGRKLVLIEIFATWCPHCQESVPALKTLEAAYPKTLQILAVNGGNIPNRPPSDAKAFRAQYHITYPILNEAPVPFKRAYHLTAFPTLYLVDRNGTILWTHLGTLESSDVKALKAQIQ